MKDRFIINNTVVTMIVFYDNTTDIEGTHTDYIYCASIKEEYNMTRLTNQ